MTPSKADSSVLSWITDLVLGAASALPSVEGFEFGGYITSPVTKNQYGLYRTKTGQPLGSSSIFNLWLCLLPSGQLGLLKIAKDTSHNSALAAEVEILQHMRQNAIQIDQDAEAHGHKLPSYHYFFPEVLDSFLAKTQDNRRVVVLGYPETIDSTLQMMSLARLINGNPDLGIEPQRVDPKTSIWIIGKLLKVLGFAHSVGIANSMVTGMNILIEPDIHALFLFDWSRARRYEPGAIPSSIIRSELVQAGKWGVLALDGNTDTAIIPETEHQLTGADKEVFEGYLRQLATGNFPGAYKAHNALYDMADSIWVRAYHHFTTYPRSEE